jgi:hypothetical protein
MNFEVGQVYQVKPGQIIPGTNREIPSGARLLVRHVAPDSDNVYGGFVEDYPTPYGTTQCGWFIRKTSLLPLRNEDR